MTKINFSKENITIFFIQIAYYTHIQYKSMQTYKRKQHKHNKYVNVGEIFDQREPYHLKSSNCFMKVQTTDKRSEVGLSM